VLFFSGTITAKAQQEIYLMQSLSSVMRDTTVTFNFKEDHILGYKKFEGGYYQFYISLDYFLVYNVLYITTTKTYKDFKTFNRYVTDSIAYNIPFKKVDKRKISCLYELTNKKGKIFSNYLLTFDKTKGEFILYSSVDLKVIQRYK